LGVVNGDEGQILYFAAGKAAQSPLTYIGGLGLFSFACHTGAISVSNFDL
jgi:hypothetical protein